MSKRRFGVIILLVLALSLVCSTVPQTNDPVPLIISEGTDGIATVDGYNISINSSIVVDANTTFTDVVHLYCPLGYNDTIGIANLALNSSQIKELQIFVNYSNQKIILTHYQDGSINHTTFTLYPETEAIMGISIIPTPTVINAGPIDPIYYNIVCSYEVGVCGVNITDVVFSMHGTPVTDGYPSWTIQVNVTVHNNGTIPINCTVNAYYHDGSTWVQIGTPQNITNLANCTTTTRTFNWDLAGLTPCTSYTVKANATCTCDASDEFINGQVKVKLVGDADGSGSVGFMDLSLLGVAFGADSPEHPRYNLDVDFDASGSVGFMDLSLLGTNFGKSC